MPYALDNISKTIGIGAAAVAALFTVPVAASDLQGEAGRALPTIATQPAAFSPVAVPALPIAFDFAAGQPAISETCAASAVFASSAKPVSALERMRMSQSTAGAQPSGASLQPAARFGVSCRQPAASPFAMRPRASSPQDFLQSRILPVSKTGFDSEWNRVRDARSGRAAAAAAHLSAANGSVEARIEAVNRWVNAKVDYVEDAQLYARADYWASAEQTLRAGKGDCEDFAIAKMHILAAMGIAREDMYLTIARDLVARGDHAVLIVRIDGKAMVLDNATDTIADGHAATDLRPVLSFSGAKRFIHGYS